MACIARGLRMAWELPRPCSGSEQEKDDDLGQASTPLKKFEFALHHIIPFLAYHLLAYTSCPFTPGRTPATKESDHLHTWCRRCAERPNNVPLGPLHEACSDCVALRTLSVLATRWHTFCWDDLTHTFIQTCTHIYEHTLIPTYIHIPQLAQHNEQHMDEY